MISRGYDFEFTRSNEVYDAKTDSYYEEIETLYIDWEAEDTEDGSGRPEIDFSCCAKKEDGTEVELTEDEEDRIYGQLRDSGEF